MVPNDELHRPGLKNGQKLSEVSIESRALPFNHGMKMVKKI